MTIDLLKHSAIPWSYEYKDPNSGITYDVHNTCPIDTALQMVFFLWFRGFVPHSVVEKDSLLLQTMIHIRDQNYDQARHEFQIKTIRPKKTKMDGNRDVWNCAGDPFNYRQFPVLFASNGPVCPTWENCSKKGEDCPFHDRYVRLSTRGSNLKPKRFEFVTDPKQKGTIQEIIDRKYGACEVPCVGNLTFTPDDLDSNVKDEPMVGQGHAIRCPYDGMRKPHCVANYQSCPWVMVFGAYFQHYSFHTLNDIPKSVMVPPETQYSLACVILSNGAHFRGISLDIRNSPGIHLMFDGINELDERVQIISLDDPLSKIAPTYRILELWYVKVDSGGSSSGSGTASSTIPPMAPSASATIPPMPPNEILAKPAHALSTVLKPVGIKTLGHTCYLNTLMQIIFWVVPLRKKLSQKKQPKNVPKNLQPIFSVDFEADSETLFNSFVFLKRLLQNMQPSKNTKSSTLSNNMTKFVDTLGLSHDVNQCVNEFWSNLFHTYFEYVGVDHLYMLQMTTHYREVLEPNKTGKAREKKETLSQTLLSLGEPDLKK
jgi:Ubiquitin carboxyl-terminal hydrolase